SLVQTRFGPTGNTARPTVQGATGSQPLCPGKRKHRHTRRKTARIPRYAAGSLAPVQPTHPNQRGRRQYAGDSAAASQSTRSDPIMGRKRTGSALPAGNNTTRTAGKAPATASENN